MSKKRHKLLVAGLIVLGLSGCTPSLSSMEKSDLMVAAGQIKNSICDSESYKFYKAYEGLIEDGKRSNLGEVEDLLLEGWVAHLYDKSLRMAASYDEAENMEMRGEKIIKEMDFYSVEEMEDLADLITSIDVSTSCSD